MTTDTVTHINGPVNLARIDGEIDNQKKTFYMFMDYHEKVGNETMCGNTEGSQDIHRYLLDKIKNISKTDDEYHIFIESAPVFHKNGAGKTRGRYADDVINLLLETFTEPGGTGGIIYTSKNEQYNNIKLHFVDIRTFIFQDIDNMFADLMKYVDKSREHVSLPLELIKKYQVMLKKINAAIIRNYNQMIKSSDMSEGDIVEMIKKTAFTDDKDDDDDKNSQILKNKMLHELRFSLITKKINSSYKNDKVQTEIMDYMTKTIGGVVKELHKQHADIQLYLKDKALPVADVEDDVLNTINNDLTYGPSAQLVADTVHDINKMIHTYYKLWFTRVSSKYMDMYVLRKLLDQKFNNVILYTGIEHSVSLSYFLLSRFNFEITKMSTVNGASLDELNELIKNKTPYDSVRKYFFPEVLKQCTNVEEFDDFSTR